MSDKFPFEHFMNFKEQENNFKNIEQNQVLKDSGPIEPNSSFNTEELTSITEEILSILEKSISPQKYNAFFKNTFTITELSDSKVVFSVTTEFIRKMINNHYLQILDSCVTELMGQKYDISIKILGKQTVSTTTESNQNFATQILKNLENPNFANSNQSKNISFKLESDATKEEIIEYAQSAELKHLQPKVYGNIQKSKIFENFIVGPSNNMAHAFSQAVAKSPGEIYPQLYLYGNSGLGKTHLLHAICNYIANKNPQTKICLITANDFTKEMVSSIQSKTIDQFKKKYTDMVDVLIIDDIHELKNRTRTQAEFFEIFNELQSKKKQLIFTSDKPPKEIDGIEDRILTRLSSALLIDIKQPDLETRIAILKKKAIEKDIYIGDDVINLIAQSVKTNVRELEGKLIRLGAYSDLMNVDIDLEIAKEQLGLSEDNIEKIITIDLIARTVAKYFKLPLGDIKGKARKADLVLARHIAMYLSHKSLKKTLEEIGDYFDKRDHSTVIHAIDKITKRSKEDQKVQQQIFEIETDLNL